MAQCAHPADQRGDRRVAAAAAVMVAGLYLDGWAHLSVLDGRLGGFLTPWHGVLYIGWALSAFAIVTAGQCAGARWHASRLLTGYAVGVGGLVLSAAGAAADIVWHELFGEEEGVARLLSPPHLLLFLGMALMASTPLRAAWLRPGSRPSPAAVVSAIETLAIVLFVTQPLSPLVDWRGEGRPGPHELGIPAILLFGVILVAAASLLLRRWQLAPGSLCLIVAVPVAALALAGRCTTPVRVVVLIAAAAAADAIATTCGATARSLT